MKKLLITIKDDIYKLLTDEKEKTGASMAEIIRRAIKHYLKQA